MLHCLPFVIVLFQFYLSSIKSWFIFHSDSDISRFQFYLSSIKSCGVPGRTGKRRGFNSTLVQLKANLESNTRYAGSSFQFYLSSIKRRRVYQYRYLFCKFQFYLSSIKSSKVTLYLDGVSVFQFYLSSIKSRMCSLFSCLRLLDSILP